MVGTTGKGWLAGMVVAGALFGAGAVAGLEESPRDQLERVTSHLLEGIRQSPQEDRESLKAFVEETVEPELDRDRILRIILGKMRYAQTSVEDRAAFYDALKTQMFRLYAESLSANSDGTLRYLPYEEDSSKPYQVVRSEFSRPSGESLEILYLVRKVEEHWRVFEIRVDGIFLVRNLRDTLAPEIERDGLRAVTKRLCGAPAEGAQASSGSCG